MYFLYLTDIVSSAFGCPEYKAPANTWAELKDGYIVAGCDNTDETWRMRCIGNHWLGPVKDCSQGKWVCPDMKRFTLIVYYSYTMRQWHK